MGNTTLQQRIKSLESELAELKARFEQFEKQKPETKTGTWLDDVYGKFNGDPLYKKAMSLGRKYRESLRPKPRKKRNDRSRH